MTQEWKNTKCPIPNSWLNNNEKKTINEYGCLVK